VSPTTGAVIVGAISAMSINRPAATASTAPHVPSSSEHMSLRYIGSPLVGHGICCVAVDVAVPSPELS